MPPPAGQLLEAELAAADGEERVYPRVLDLSAMVGLQEFDELHRHLAECPTRRASRATSDPSNTRRVLGLLDVWLEVVSNFLAAAAARSRPFNTMVRVMGDLFGGAFRLTTRGAAATAQVEHRDLTRPYIAMIVMCAPPPRLRLSSD